MRLRPLDPSVPHRRPHGRRLAPLLMGALLTASLLATEGGLGAPPAQAAVPLPAAIPLNAAIPAVAGPCVAGWREMPVPDSVFISTPFEVLTRNDKPAWILGGSNDGVLALKWNGSAWQKRATNSTRHRGLNGGAILSARSVLGVGYARPLQEDGGSLDPISGRIVGNLYKGRKVPDPPGSRATLTEVVRLPRGKAWAVGTRLQGGRLRAYAILWNGRAWKRFDPFGGSGSGLLAVERAASGTWIAGWREASKGRPRPYIARRTKSGWKGTRGAPGLAAGTAAVTDLAFSSSSRGYAVGYVVASGSSRHDAFLQQWNGNKWTMVNLPWTSDFSAVPRSVAAGPDGELWIGGTQLATADREERGFIAHRKDGIWDVSVLGTPKDVHSEVMDVAPTEWGAVAAAAVGASLLVLRTCDAGEVSTAQAGRSIAISNMQARREADDSAPDHGAVPDAAHDDGAIAAPPAVASATTFNLAAPVASKGFVVRNVTASAGLAENTRTYDGFASDMNGDGWTDIFYSRHGGVLPRLALGSANGFSYVPTGAAFTASDRHGCAPADVNRDGDTDIFCAIGAARGKILIRHELSLSVAKGNSRLARGSAGINDPFGRGRQVAFLRLDKDAYPEVFVTNSPDRGDGLPAYNRFYRNKGGKFVSAPGVGLDTSQGGACLLTGDFDKDGDQDLAYCVQEPVNGGTPGLRFMRNERGRLVDRTGRLRIRPMNDIDVEFADVNGDRKKDLIQLSSNRLRVSKWTSGGYRKIFEAKISDSWAIAVGDASGDGRPDIYVVRGSNKKNLPDRLLVNKNGGRRFTSVKIPQTSQGTGDDVIALDYDKNGLKDFLVLNGRKKAGPIQLLASFKR